MNISDEAVEAAARALCDLAEDDWFPGANGAYEDQAAAALQAAAPHLMAEAWEEGRLDGHAEEQSGFENAMNPYRAGAGE